MREPKPPSCRPAPAASARAAPDRCAGPARHGSARAPPGSPRRWAGPALTPRNLQRERRRTGPRNRFRGGVEVCERQRRNLERPTGLGNDDELPGLRPLDSRRAWLEIALRLRRVDLGAGHAEIWRSVDPLQVAGARDLNLTVAASPRSSEAVGLAETRKRPCQKSRGSAGNGRPSRRWASSTGRLCGALEEATRRAQPPSPRRSSACRPWWDREAGPQNGVVPPSIVAGSLQGDSAPNPAEARVLGRGRGFRSVTDSCVQVVREKQGLADVEARAAGRASRGSWLGAPGARSRTRRGPVEWVGQRAPWRLAARAATDPARPRSRSGRRLLSAGELEAHRPDLGPARRHGCRRYV